MVPMRALGRRPPFLPIHAYSCPQLLLLLLLQLNHQFLSALQQHEGSSPSASASQNQNANQNLDDLDNSILQQADVGNSQRAPPASVAGSIGKQRVPFSSLLFLSSLLFALLCSALLCSALLYSANQQIATSLLLALAIEFSWSVKVFSRSLYLGVSFD